MNRGNRSRGIDSSKNNPHTHSPSRKGPCWDGFGDQEAQGEEGLSGRGP